MRYFTALIFSFLFIFQASAQRLELALKNIPIEIEVANFYISKVIDSRIDTTRLGWSLHQ